LILDFLFISISVILCIPTAQLLLDVLDDSTDFLSVFDTYGGSDLVDWFRDDDHFGPVTLGVFYSCFTLVLYVLHPLAHAVVVSITSSWLLWSTHKIDKKMELLREVLSSGETKCHKHLDITTAVCLELDGTIVKICYKCDPEKAKEYGILKGEDADV
jgi:hypothetical protein